MVAPSHKLSKHKVRGPVPLSPSLSLSSMTAKMLARLQKSQKKKDKKNAGWEKRRSGMGVSEVTDTSGESVYSFLENVLERVKGKFSFQDIYLDVKCN